MLARPKFGLPQDLLAKWFELFDGMTVGVDVDVEIEFARDQRDAKFLSCAMVSDADFLITGDRDFSQAERLVNTAIISVSLFKELVCDSL